MFDLKTALLLLVTLTTLAIGFTVYFRQRNNPASLAFVFFTLGIALWALTNALFQITVNSQLGYLYALASYYAGLIIAAPFYSFSLNFPQPLPPNKQRRSSIILWIYCLLWGAMIGIPGLTLKEVVYDPTGRLITGYGLYFYGISLLIFLLGGLFHLWRKKKSVDLIAQRQINLIFFGALFSVLFGSVFNFILPLFGNYSLVWLGPDFTLILVVCMAYAIMKHNLFNVRIITTELFTALLGLVLVIELLRAQTWVEFGARLAVLLIFTYIGYRLLQSVYEEIRAKEALKRLLDAKTDFIHAASHQLRTPLSAIRGMLTMLYEGDYDSAGPDEKKRVQSNILLSVERLVDTVNDLLYAAEVEQGMSGAMDLGSVEPLLQHSLDTLRTNFDQKGLQIHCQLPSQLLPHIPMRASYLQQVFLNLLDNAERYTVAPGTVELRLHQEHDNIIFEISDTGIGLTPEDEEKLFTRFGRSEAAKRMQPNGSGLGLYIVKRIVEEHGGTITAHSPGRNQGTTFRVILPTSPGYAINK